MKKLKVSLVSPTELKLEEPGVVGDVIDLKHIDQTLDRSHLDQVLAQLQDQRFEQQLQKQLQQQQSLWAREQQVLLTQQKLAQAQQQQAQWGQLHDENVQLQAQLKLMAAAQAKDISAAQNAAALQNQAQLEQLRTQLREREHELQRLSDFRTRLSTKLLGESLEQHCEVEFNRVGRLAFPQAQFMKDNDVRTGSKGDYIYREVDENNQEVLTIMFEMKNESETTATKHKNSHFYKELDKDRTEKHCEYAVLVSMLELDHALFNDIYVVPEYKNMFVIRPQHFIQIINFLRMGNVKSLQYKQVINQLQTQHADVGMFEQHLSNFKETFGRNYRLASERFNGAIEEIDKTINHLTKVREDLLGSIKQLGLANDKAEDLSIKRLTKDSPGLRAQFSKTKK